LLNSASGGYSKGRLARIGVFKYVLIQSLSDDRRRKGKGMGTVCRIVVDYFPGRKLPRLRVHMFDVVKIMGYRK
jgi:hypothetical protein